MDSKASEANTLKSIAFEFTEARETFLLYNFKSNFEVQWFIVIVNVS